MRATRLRRTRSAAADPGEGSCRDLLEQLRVVVDPRDRRGIRHQLVPILAVAAAAVVAGARSYVAVEQWAAHAPTGVLAVREVRVNPRTGRFVVPCKSTIRRTLQACDSDQIDAVLGAWLYPRLDTEQVIVDGKTLRGARASRALIGSASTRRSSSGSWSASPSRSGWRPGCAWAR